MSANNDKERFGDLCKQHAGRGEKDLSRVCPSKLSKRELEDLYYSLLDNNLELKRAVNGQNEKIRLLTTKVNRMTAQNKIYLPRDQKDCCAGAKAIITDQKASIADLKKANECMSERIKRLNMRLCSAKQFLKKSPSQTINKCYKCFSGASTQKNQSTSALNNKGSDMDLKNKAQETPDRDSPKKLNVETNTIEWEHLIQHLKNEKSCNENKCRSTMDELKRKIVDLQEELSNSRKDNMQRMNQLESQVARMQALAQRRSDHALRRDRDAAQAEGEKEQLEIQLTTEKMKVAELETRLKSAHMSKEVATAIEKHLSHAKTLEEPREPLPNSKRCMCSVCPRLSQADAPTANTQTESRMSNMLNLIRPTTYEDKQTTSDDSGYAEQNQDPQKEGVFSKINEEIINKVAYLQEQLNFIKSALVGTPASEKPSRSTFDSYETDVKDFDVPILKNVKDYTCVVVDPKSNAIIEIAHVNRNTTDDEDDEEIVDSDIEGNYNEKVKTKDHQSMTSVKTIGESRPPTKLLKADRLEDEKEIVILDENTNLDNIRRKGSRISLPEIVKQETAFNDNVMSQKDGENLQKCTIENETKERDSIVEPQFKKTDTVKCHKHVVCECPACEAEAAKNKEAPLSRVQSRDIFENKVRPSISEEEIPLKTKTKPDTHNSLQIPGPLPISKTDSANNKTHNRVNKNLEKNTKDDSTNLDNPEEKKEVSGEVNGDDVKKTATYGRDVDATSSKKGVSENFSAVGKSIPEKEKNAQIKPEANDNVAKLIEIDGNKMPYSRRISIISLEDERSPVNDRISVPESPPQKDVNEAVRKIRTVKEEVKRLNEKAVESVPCSRGKNNLLEMDSAICGRYPCLCPEDLPPTRRCCKCPTVAAPNADINNSDSKPAGPDKPRPSSAGHTYTLSSEAKSRATSPDNTENEISFMSDLPTEKEGTSRRSSLSPGEHKMTTTYQDSYTPCQWSSLSEGEVPNTTKTKKKLSISVGEHPGDEHSTVNPHFPEAAAERMEVALRSISRELARCRAMLGQRSREPSKLSKDAETLSMELNREEAHVLRRTRAAPCIAGVTAPKCVFILHIGTIVLSDEAVINSRGAPLMLTWQFFEQTAAMARMSAGRVVHFDFSAEYEVNLTGEFVEYMKHVEMPIKICEMDEKESLFAMCSLPLREALLNVNRRVDLSLELVSSHPTSRKAHDSLDTSDEVGVLDLWCILRTESRNLGALNKTYGLNSALSLNDQPNKLDDAQSYSSALSQDLDLDMNCKQNMESVIEHDKMLLHRKSDKTQQTDFYVPDMSESMPPVNEMMPRHQKLSSPTVTSNLGLNTFETPKIPHIGEPNRDFEKRHDMRRSVNSVMDDYMLRDGSTLQMDNWRTMGSQPAMTEMTQNRQLNREESVSRKKRRESGAVDTAVKILKSKELEFETPSLNKMKDSSTQSMDGAKKVTIAPNHGHRATKSSIAKTEDRVIGITVLWLALNEECDAMSNPNVRRLYVAYSFLGRDGAALETPASLPKPSCYIEKCFFNFKKTFHLTEFDMPIIEHMATCRSINRKTHNSKDCIVFSVVSEPPEDPLGLENCEDIGYAYLYLGDLLAYGAGDTFTQVLPVSEASGRGVCGVLAVRLDGLNVVRARTAR